ncbi:hypothetical protein ABW19_dt0202911 [Dactylella cylindrospora]|nr:hypothetical protein ABW19_dt0202911 [Dactylella cylindrospora]
MEEVPKDIISTLPSEILILILGNISAYDLLHDVQLVSHRFRALVHAVTSGKIYGLTTTLWAKVFEYMPLNRLMRISYTCRAFNSIIEGSRSPIIAATMFREEITLLTPMPKNPTTKFNPVVRGFGRFLDCTFEKPITEEEIKERLPRCWYRNITSPPVRKAKIAVKFKAYVPSEGKCYADLVAIPGVSSVHTAAEFWKRRETESGQPGGSGGERPVTVMQLLLELSDLFHSPVRTKQLDVTNTMKLSCLGITPTDGCASANWFKPNAEGAKDVDLKIQRDLSLGFGSRWFTPKTISENGTAIIERMRYLGNMWDRRR